MLQILSVGADVGEVEAGKKVSNQIVYIYIYIYYNHIPVYDLSLRLVVPKKKERH